MGREKESQVPSIIVTNSVMLGVAAWSTTTRLYVRFVYLKKLCSADGEILIHANYGRP